MMEIPGVASMLIEALRAVNGAEFGENHEVLRIVDTSCSSGAVLDCIRSLDQKLKAANLGKCVLSGNIGGDYDIQQVTLDELHNESINFVVKKVFSDGLFYFFCPEGLQKALEDTSFISSARAVWVSGEFSAFASWTTWYLPWSGSKPFEIGEWAGYRDPRRLVRDLSGRSLVPSDISPWLLRHPEAPDSSPILNTWRTVAARQLSYALPNEVISTDTGLAIVVKGQRPRTIPLNHCTGNEWTSLFEALHETASWVYKVHQESDSKHTLLNYHLATEWPDGRPWPDNEPLQRILGNAGEAYRLHLQESSKELLKSLTELKKSLHDEVVRVSQGTCTLVTNLWRDFAIAAGVVALRFVTTTNTLSSVGLKLLSLATSVFILVSLFITMYSNRRFQNITERSREDWRKRLYGFIEETDFKELVDKPIVEGQKVYRRVAWLTGVIYVLIVLVLLNMAFPLLDLLTAIKTTCGNLLQTLSP